MGRPKALLPLNDRFFIDVIISHLHIAGFNPIIAVLGADSQQIQKKAKLDLAQVAINEQPERGQLSSLQCGLERIQDQQSGTLVTLVDHALVRRETYQSMRQEIEKQPQHILQALYGGRHGHPVYFPFAIVRKLLEADAQGNARDIIRQNRKLVREVPVNDPAIRFDIDTPQDYRKRVKS